jgi:hypothetical protein
MKPFTLIALVGLIIPIPILASESYWNTVDRLNRRTCPSTQCGVVGRLFFREGATVYEVKNGWARITPAYNASCKNGHSEYVDSGNSACIASNGIHGGKFSEWVAFKYLSKNRPPDPAEDETGLTQMPLVLICHSQKMVLIAAYPLTRIIQSPLRMVQLDIDFQRRPPRTQ